MSKKSIAKNYAYNLTYQILILILPLITTPYISRVLGAENIGIYSYTLSIATYFVLFGSLGIAMYAQREIAYVQDDVKKRSKIFVEIIILRLITMFISTLIYYFMFINGSEFQLYYKILLLEILANCLDISWYFQGLEEFKKTIMRNMIVKILSILCIFLFVKSPENLVTYFIIYVASNLLGNMSLWLYLHKYLKKVKLKEIKVFKHLKPTISFFIPQIAIQCYVLLDKVMLGAIINNKSEVGYYEQAQKLVKVFLTVITALGTVMFPRIANNYIKGEKETINRYMHMSFKFIFLLSIPMILGIIIISSNFVPLFLGNGYDKVPIIMKVISPILLMIGLSNATGTQYLLSTQRQKEYTISVFVGAICNCIANLIFIPQLGAIGAAIGTVIAETMVTTVQFFCIRKDINILKVIKSSVNYIISGIIMFLICVILGNLISNYNSIIIIGTQILLGCFIYFSILIFVIKDEFVISILDKVKNKIVGPIKKGEINE